MKKAASSEIGVQYILLYHLMGVEERAVQCNGVTHDIDEALSVVVKKRENNLLKLVIKQLGVPGRVVGLNLEEKGDALMNKWTGSL